MSRTRRCRRTRIRFRRRPIVRYAREHDRLILPQDDDFFAGLDIEETAGVLFQRDQTLSTPEVGDAVHERSQYLDQSDVILEYVSRNWP